MQWGHSRRQQAMQLNTTKSLVTLHHTMARRHWILPEQLTILSIKWHIQNWLAQNACTVQLTLHHQTNPRHYLTKTDLPHTRSSEIEHLSIQNIDGSQLFCFQCCNGHFTQCRDYSVPLMIKVTHCAHYNTTGNNSTGKKTYSYC